LYIKKWIAQDSLTTNKNWKSEIDISLVLSVEPENPS
jgi:hypothetical protein